MRAFFGLLALLAAGSAAAQFSGSLTLHSDYRHRGVSYSEGDPSVQGTLAYEHPNGWFAGAAAQNVKIQPVQTRTRTEVLLYGGYARPLFGRLGGEVGALRYLYPGSTAQPNWNYSEVFAGLSFERSAVRLFYSDNYFGEGGRSWYLDLNHTLDLGRGLALFLHAGHLQFARDYAYDRRGAPNRRWDGRVTLSYTRERWRFDAGVAGTFRISDDCLGQSELCHPGVVFSASYRMP